MKLLPALLALRSNTPYGSLALHIAHGLCAWSLSGIGNCLKHNGKADQNQKYALPLLLSVALVATPVTALMQNARMVLFYIVSFVLIPLCRNVLAHNAFLPEVVLLITTVTCAVQFDGLRETWLVLALFRLVNSAQLLARSVCGKCYPRLGSLLSKAVWFLGLYGCLQLLHLVWMLHEESDVLHTMLERPNSDAGKHAWEHFSSLERAFGLRSDSRAARILGVHSPDASNADIKRAYRRAMLHAHPDKAPNGMGLLQRATRYRQQKRLEDVQWAMSMLTQASTREAIEQRLSALSDRLFNLVAIIIGWIGCSAVQYAYDLWNG